jgi:hypothetical protein
VPRAIYSCLLFILVWVLPIETAKNTEKRTEFGVGVQTGFSLAEYHDTCIVFQVFFISGQFFSGLRRFETSSGLVFKKGPETYRTFPDRLIVDVQATAYRCSGVRGRIPPPDLGGGLLGALSFQLKWRAGSEMQIASLVSTQTRHRPPGIRWDYFLELSAKDIPLSDSLLIDVVARDHIHLTRLTADLK